MLLFSGGSRISRGESSYCLTIFSPKTAWKWRKFGRWGPFIVTKLVCLFVMLQRLWQINQVDRILETFKCGHNSNWWRLSSWLSSFNRRRWIKLDDPPIITECMYKSIVSRKLLVRLTSLDHWFQMGALTQLHKDDVVTTKDNKAAFDRRANDD